MSEINPKDITHYIVKISYTWRHDKKRQAFKLVRRLMGRPIPKMRCCAVDKFTKFKWIEVKKKTA